MIAIPHTCPYCVSPLTQSGDSFECPACKREFASSRPCPACGFDAYQLDERSMCCSGCGRFDRRIVRAVDLEALLPADAHVVAVGVLVQRLSRQAVAVLRLLAEDPSRTVIAVVAPFLSDQGLDLGETIVAGGFAPYAVIAPTLDFPRTFGKLDVVPFPIKNIDPDWASVQKVDFVSRALDEAIESIEEEQQHGTTGRSCPNREKGAE